MNFLKSIITLTFVFIALIVNAQVLAPVFDVNGKQSGYSNKIDSLITKDSAVATFQNKSVYEFNRDIDNQNLIDTAAQIRSDLSNNINYVREVSDIRDDSLKAAITNVNDRIGGIADTMTIYVSKKYSGFRGSASWQSQLDEAVIGSQTFTFPDLWSARDAAEALSWKTKRPVTIRVFAGNIWTWENTGSADFIQSGSSSLKANSLIRNNVYYYFEANSGIVTSTSVAGSDITYFKEGFYGNNLLLDTLRYGIEGKGVFKNGASNVLQIQNYAETFVFECDTVISYRYAVLIRDRFSKSVTMKVLYMETGTQAEFCVGTEYAYYEVGTLLVHNNQLGADGAALHFMSNNVLFPIFSPTNRAKLNVKIRLLNSNGGQGVSFGRGQYIDAAIEIDKYYQLGDSTLTNCPSAFSVYDAGNNYFKGNNVELKVGIYVGDFDIMRFQTSNSIDSTSIELDCTSCNTKQSVISNYTSKGSSGYSNQFVESYVSAKGIFKQVATSKVSLTGTNSALLLQGIIKSSSVALTTSSEVVKLLGIISVSDNSNSVVGTGTITAFPSSATNVAATVTTINGTLNVNSAFKL